MQLVDEERKLMDNVDEQEPLLVCTQYFQIDLRL